MKRLNEHFEFFLDIARLLVKTRFKFIPLAVPMINPTTPKNPLRLHYGTHEKNCYEWFKAGVYAKKTECKSITLIQLVKITDLIKYVIFGQQTPNEIEKGILLAYISFEDELKSFCFVYDLKLEKLFEVRLALIQDIYEMVQRGYQAWVSKDSPTI
jgi:hypothetical protein